MRLVQLLRTAFSEAFHALKAKPLHTILSLLGIIIGVGALISILALGDGMEKFGRDQIANTTDLNAIQVSANNSILVDGIRMEKQNKNFLKLEDWDSLKTLVNGDGIVKWMSYSRDWIKNNGDTVGLPTNVLVTLPNFFEPKDSIVYGSLFNQKHITSNDHVAVINLILAKKLINDTSKMEALIGQDIFLSTIKYKIIGIIHSARDQSRQSNIVIPLTTINNELLRQYTTSFLVIANKIENLPAIKAKIDSYFSRAPYTKEDFTIRSNDFRVDQLKRGILLFKSIMGLIVGISILVGGIGIMNVLLMSVTERTREIGIRKALGAKPKEIAMQFMAEAMTISLMGSLLGILFGMATLAIALPIIKKILKGDIIHISYEIHSLVLILFIALIIGLVFGTYPAYKASKQSPIDAIRVE
jgi:putative ABC transport system permease protein